MSDVNISRDEAQDRSTRITAGEYQVTIDLSGRYPDGSPLENPEATFFSQTRVTFTSRGGDDTINLIADQVYKAELDGHPISTDLVENRLHFNAGEGEHVLEIEALCRYSRTGEGLHRFIDPADDKIYLYTQFETADARRVFANFEQPDQKATFQFDVIAPQSWVVLNNTSPAAEPEVIADGIVKHRFETSERMSTYITALVAGEYYRVDDVYNGAHGEIPMAIVCRQSLVEHLDAGRIFEVTKRGFDVLEEAFDFPYPFGKYDQAFVPEYNAGAMENAGLVTLRDEYIFRSRVTDSAYQDRDNTILHELTHMWFGDLVTMKWWDDLWLNESFAEWGSHFAQEKIGEKFGINTYPWATFANQRKGWAYTQDQLPTTHPIAADMVDLETVELNFDGITYAKGASVLKLLVSVVGEEAFLKGVRKYFKKFAFQNTTLEDLLRRLEASSGRDLSWFTGQWLETAGVNTLRADFDVDDAGNFTRFDVVQTAPAQWPTIRNHRLRIGFYALDGDKLVRRDQIEVDVHGERTPIAALEGKPRHDFILLNDDDLTYAKVRLDEASLRCLVDNIDKLDDRLARALCWGAAWDMVRDAEMTAAEYIDLVLRGIGNEPDKTAIRTILAQTEAALARYAAPEQRETLRQKLTVGLVKLLKEALATSDEQLMFATALARVVRGDVGAQVLRGWLKGEEVPPGLAMDTDMRWNVLGGLALMNEATDEMIDEELSKDNSITGREWAALIRASRPTEQAKEMAWHIAVEDPTTPNETQRKVAFRFHQPDQDDVLLPYVDRYFAMVEDIAHNKNGWDQRSGQIAQVAVAGMFPSFLIRDDILKKVDEFLERTELKPNIRRQVVEQRAQMERALKAQAYARDRIAASSS